RRVVWHWISENTNVYCHTPSDPQKCTLNIKKIFTPKKYWGKFYQKITCQHQPCTDALPSFWLFNYSTSFTRTALGPFWPFSVSKVTLSPSRTSSSKPLT